MRHHVEQVLTNDDMLASPPLSRGFNLKPHCVRPESTGSVRLSSANPRAKPLIDPNYLGDAEGHDLQVCVSWPFLALH
jgi:choline dehydrogenase-like flavoprotein